MPKPHLALLAAFAAALSAAALSVAAFLTAALSAAASASAALLAFSACSFSQTVMLARNVSPSATPSGRIIEYVTPSTSKLILRSAPTPAGTIMSNS